MEAGAEAVMTSYNEINGIPAIVNSEVQDILKDTYGLPGHVVCDGGDFQQTVNDHKYFATHAETVAYGLKAGVDGFTDDGNVVRAGALEKGLMTVEDIDRSIRNSFRTRIRMGFFDGDRDCPYSEMGEEYVNNEDHKNIALQMAKESVVLLKNEAGQLPFRPENTKSLAVIGPLADVWYKDWYCGIPPYSVTPLAGIRSAYPNAEVTFESGLSDVRLICGGKYVGLDEEDRLILTGKDHVETFQFTDWGCGRTTLRAHKNGLLVTLEEGTDLLRASKKEAFSWFVKELWKFADAEDGNVDVDTADAGKRFCMDSWDGQRVIVSPGGHLTVQGEASVVAGGAASADNTAAADPLFALEIVRDALADAAATAAAAQKAVVVIGSNPVINSKEEIDRTTLALPPAQQRLVDRVLAANPDTAVVLVTNYPYSMTEIQEKAPAILYSASGSQELGNGIAAVLSGETAPAGRLPQTWYLSEKDLPPMEDYDIIKGCRTYQYFEKEVLYPFGYGLSYTAFSYGPMEISQDADAVTAVLTVTNTGNVTGDEVVQLYAHKEASRVKQPVKQLVAFERVKNLAPGETKEVRFAVKKEELTYFDVISRKKLLEESDYTFLAGASSGDIRQQAYLHIAGGTVPERDPFVMAKAERYDDYENCFLHRGAKGHTTADDTCVIPGRAGDAPDVVCGQKLSGSLSYRDFCFEKQPTIVTLRVCGVEAGEILLTCKDEKGAAGTSCTVAVEKSEDLAFGVVKAVLPEGFVKAPGKYELTISVNGKVKLAEFVFG